MANNIFQTRLEPEKPKILSSERIYVYVPNATTRQAGIASYDSDYFTVDANSKISVKPHTFTMLDNFKDNEFNVDQNTDEVSINWNNAELELSDYFVKINDYNNRFGDWTNKPDGVNTVRDWFNRLENQDSSLDSRLDVIEPIINSNTNRIITIENKIPEAASVSNKLVDKNQLDNQVALVNTSIQTLYDRFGTWNPVQGSGGTVQGWFEKLETQDETLDESLSDLRDIVNNFHNVYETPADLPTATAALYGSTAFVLSTSTIWSVRLVSGTTDQYEWYDTEQTTDLMDIMEIDASVYRADGTPSAGISKRWAQSDHRHPTDETRLAKTIYQSTNVGVISTFNNNSADDFNFNLWEEEAGTYLPNRQVNIPYVRKSKSLHNWQGNNSVFTDSQSTEEYYWAGTSLQFESEKDLIHNNSLIVIDDDEDSGDQEVDLVNRRMLEVQGITIDFDEPTEQIVTIANTNMIGKILTLEKVTTLKGDRYRLKAINTGNVDDMLIVHYGGYDPMTGNPIDSIKAKSIANDKLVVGGSNGKITEGISQSLIVKANNGDIVSGTILVGGSSNYVSSVSTGVVEGINLIADGNGGLKTKTYTAGKMIYTDNNGILAEFPTSASDEGKAFGVNAYGQPTLLTIPTVPNTLPVTTVTTAPSASNINGMVICKLSNDPETYVDGVLYMW